MLFAMTSALSKMDHQIRSGAHGVAFERDQAALEHLFDLFELAMLRNMGEMRNNADESMRRAAAAARRHNDTLPNGDYYLHESSPVAQGLGKNVVMEHIQQFPGETLVEMGDAAGGDGAAVGQVKAPPTKKAAKK
jgi:hypothetical protein